MGMYAMAESGGEGGILTLSFVALPVKRTLKRRTNQIGGTPQRIGIEMRIARGRCRLAMSKEATHDRKSQAATCAKAAEVVPKSVE